MLLKQNDLVALVSPAGRLADISVVSEAQHLLQKWGLNSYVGKNALKQDGHFAGTDAERLHDLQKAMDNSEVKMIWALRGGYGSIRIVDDLDFTQFKKHPKWLIGFSDITVLHQKWQQLGFKSIHGFMPVQLKDKITKNVVHQTKNALFGHPVNYQFNKHKKNTDFKTVKGRVIGGNLANLYSLLGTDLDFDTTDKILFLEDVDEQLYQIDRMMMALKKAGKLDALKALLVGQFSEIPSNNPSFGIGLEDIILEHTSGKYPVVFEAPIGHITNNYPLILGHDLSLSQDENLVTISQPAITKI